MLTKSIGSNLLVSYGQILELPMNANSGTIYGGATVVLKLTGADEGYAFPATDDTDDSEKQIVMGWAQEEIVGAAGKKVRVRRDGMLRRAAVGADATWLGKLACVKDDETVQLYDAGVTCKVVVGRITKVNSASRVSVDFGERPLRLATASTN